MLIIFVVHARGIIAVFAFLFFSNPLFAQSGFEGAGRCSAASCHGGTDPKKNEFTRWAREDKHAKAYGVLFNERSQTMAAILKVGKPHESELCLSCHLTGGGKASFPDRQEGVSCEACHGAAAKWLEPHTTKTWHYSQGAALGLTDLRNQNVRAEICLRCHAGLNHTILAAGHPDVVFELDTFSAAMPKHWREKSALPGTKNWMFGQAVALKKHFERLRGTTQKREVFDESFRNCFACHHNLYDTRWTLQTDSSGQAEWNPARYAVFRHFLKRFFPEDEEFLSGKIALIEKNFSLMKPDMAETISASEAVVERMKDVLSKLHQTPLSQNDIQELLAAISSDQSLYLNGNFRIAEQALMAMDALSLDLQSPQKNALRKQMKVMYAALDLADPARYVPKEFCRTVREFHKLLQKAKVTKLPTGATKPWWKSTTHLY